MYINSPGGIVSSGLAIYDTMQVCFTHFCPALPILHRHELVCCNVQYIRSPISTLCMGQAASMASLLLCAGEKGRRLCLPHARIMLHQPSGGYQASKEPDLLTYCSFMLLLWLDVPEFIYREIVNGHSRWPCAVQGQVSDIAIHAQEILRMRTNLNQIYAKHTGQSVDLIGMPGLSRLPQPNRCKICSCCPNLCAAKVHITCKDRELFQCLSCWSLLCRDHAGAGPLQRSGRKQRIWAY